MSGVRISLKSLVSPEVGSYLASLVGWQLNIIYLDGQPPDQDKRRTCNNKDDAILRSCVLCETCLLFLPVWDELLLFLYYFFLGFIAPTTKFSLD